LVIKPVDPDWIRIGILPKMLDPDQLNPDPKHWFKGNEAHLNNQNLILWIDDHAAHSNQSVRITNY
jgi:hypothetical protein